MRKKTQTHSLFNKAVMGYLRDSQRKFVVVCSHFLPQPTLFMVLEIVLNCTDSARFMCTCNGGGSCGGSDLMKPVHLPTTRAPSSVSTSYGSRSRDNSTTTTLRGISRALPFAKVGFYNTLNVYEKHDKI